VGFYGHHEAPKRYEEWALLKYLTGLAPSPWLCIIDFNVVTNGMEKWGGSARQRSSMQAFQHALECNLFDLGFCGPRYTWSNCREDEAFIKERLDRGVANLEWRSLFPEAVVLVEAVISSDHAPLFLTIQRQPRRKSRPKQFRYKADWTLDKECKEVIRTTWQQPWMLTMRWDGLEKKLDACKQGLSQWRDNAQEPKFGTITRMKAQLADLQDQEEVGNNESISRLKHDIQVQLGKEDLWWRQRAKVDWYGDRNTQYFHACVQSQRKKNRIERILDERGQWWESSDGVGKAFINYFTNLFTAGREGDLGQCLQHIEGRVMESMNAILVEEFKIKEISYALNQMVPIKAPRPDGLNANFFQQNWAILGEEVCKGVLDILNFGFMPPDLNLTSIALIPKTNKAKCVTDFRPISLCNVLYKIVSKVLANRLKKVLPFIISPI
jgi:hypothetical protein